MGKRGRKPGQQLDDAKRERFLADVRGGAPLRLAAMKQRIPYRSVIRWMTQGRAILDGASGDQWFAEFASDVDHARADAAMNALTRLLSTDDDWKAFKWFLEKRFPELFGPAPESEDDLGASGDGRYLEQIQRMFETAVEHATVQRAVAKGKAGGKAPTPGPKKKAGT